MKPLTVVAKNIKTSIISTHIILFLSIISKIIKNNTIAPILTLLCFFSLQNYWEHHLISAFPIIGINTTILLISIRLFLSDNKITYYFSGVLFLASCLIYELFLSFYPLTKLTFVFYIKMGVRTKKTLLK